MPGKPTGASGAFYLLLQLTDSALPIGAYSHSWGLETAVQAGWLRDRAEVQQYLLGVLHMSLAPFEGRACGLAYRLAQSGSPLGLRELHQHMQATRWAAEPRQASLDLGKRLAQLAGRTWGIPVPNPDGEPLHHPLVFGWIGAHGGMGLEDTLRAYLFSSLTGWVSAAVRLVPLGHTEGQSLLAQLHAPIEAALQQEILPKMGDPFSSPALASFAPLQERDAQAHQQLYSRLFQS
ncbi:MAG: urease accessory UreF family protein [Thermostichus sp. HHBFW_bins_43]